MLTIFCGGDTCNFKDGKLVMHCYKMHGYKMHGYKMHGYKILYGVNLNEHCNFRDGKLFISSFRIEGLTLFSPALSKKNPKQVTHETLPRENCLRIRPWKSSFLSPKNIDVSVLTIQRILWQNRNPFLLLFSFSCSITIIRYDMYLGRLRYSGAD